MHDATVSGMRCTGQDGAITQGKIGGAADHIGEEIWGRLRIGSGPLVASRILRTHVPMLSLAEYDLAEGQITAAGHAAPVSPADAP
jgi:hypothetical protein